MLSSYFSDRCMRNANCFECPPWSNGSCNYSLALDRLFVLAVNYSLLKMKRLKISIIIIAAVWRRMLWLQRAGNISCPIHPPGSQSNLCGCSRVTLASKTPSAQLEAAQHGTCTNYSHQIIRKLLCLLLNQRGGKQTLEFMQLQQLQLWTTEFVLWHWGSFSSLNNNVK